MIKVPAYHEFFNPTMKALGELGGSGSVEEINSHVEDLMNLPEEVLKIVHDPKTGYFTEVEYRLAWARTYLKKYGLINNSTRGVWALTGKADHEELDPKAIIKFVQEQNKERKAQRKSETEDVDEKQESEEMPDCEVVP